MSDHRFLISYIVNNQPESVEITAETETLTSDEVRPYLEALHSSDVSRTISDIQVMGLHRRNRPGVHPGHYQQPEG